MGAVRCNPLRSFIQASIQSKNERLAVTRGSCGEAIRDTAAFISRKFSFLFIEGGRGRSWALMGQMRVIWVMVNEVYSGFQYALTRPPNRRWLKSPNDESPRANTPPHHYPLSPFSPCPRPSRCFLFDPHKRPLFWFPGLSILPKVTGHRGRRVRLSL